MASVWIVAEDGDTRAAQLEQELTAKQSLLNGACGPIAVKSVDALTSPARGDVGVFFGGSPTHATVHNNAGLWTGFNEIATIVSSPPAAAVELPACLHSLQALAWMGGHGPALAADVVLSRLFLGRTQRRVFISYKRADGAGVARQLSTRLGDQGYSVYLDERSTPVGTAFAEEVLYQLCDSDVVLILQSPLLRRSSWIQREVALAANCKIGLIAVVWPGQDAAYPTRTLMSDQRYHPGRTAFTMSATDELDAQDLEDLVQRILEQRAALVVRRITNFMPAVAKRLQAADATITSVDPGKRIDELVGKDPASKPRLVGRYSPDRPTAHSLWSAARDHQKELPVLVFFRELVRNDPRVRALRWSLHPHRPQIRLSDV